MKNRVQRHMEIRKAIAGGNIQNQDDLLAVLKRNGYILTQATLSRDLKFLKVAKVPHPLNGYVYTMPENGQGKNREYSSRETFLADGFIELNYSGNLAVMKTLPGYASSIAAVIDDAGKWEILGTVAGDDTILIIKRDGISNNQLRDAIVSILPNLVNRL